MFNTTIPKTISVTNLTWLSPLQTDHSVGLTSLLGVSENDKLRTDNKLLLAFLQSIQCFNDIESA